MERLAMARGQLGALVLLAASCTDADLFVVVDPDSPYLRQRVNANLCAPPAYEQEVPHKILFVVDTSFSNSWSDPTPTGGMPRREVAIRNAISAHFSKGNVYFGVITFADEPRRQTYGFTNDTTVLNGAVANVANTQGGTNYSDTLWTAIDFIMQDVNQLTPAEARRTRYMIFWVSDGFPTVGVIDRASITPGVDYLVSTLEGRVASFELNTAYLSHLPPAGVNVGQYQQMQAEAVKLLTEMSTKGRGEFRDIAIGASFGFDIVMEPLRVELRLGNIVASVRTAQFGPEHPLPDSDQDGLTDAEEDALGLNDRKDDSDGDGIRDGVAMVLAASVPLTCTTGGLDRDGDGLYDCEESLLGTDATSVDTDGDSLPDGFEVHLGGSALTNDPTADLDLDGLNDAAEVALHLAPRRPNTTQDIDRWGYRYNLDATDTAADGRPCYEFTIDNLSMYETQPVGGSPRGYNLIEVVASFVADDEDSAVIFRHAKAGALFLVPDFQEPATGRVRLDDADFLTMGP